MKFCESFMLFVFDDNNAFRIEQDDLVVKSNGIKACECIALIGGKLEFLEAKSSTPKPTNHDNVHSFLSDICQKFDNSIQLYTDIKAGKHGKTALLRLPVGLRHTTVAAANYLVCLIICGHKYEWLPGLLDTFKHYMSDVAKKWGMKDTNIKVYNELSAKEKGIIVNYIPKKLRLDMQEPSGNPCEHKIMEWFEQHQV